MGGERGCDVKRGFGGMRYCPLECRAFSLTLVRAFDMIKRIMVRMMMMMILSGVLKGYTTGA